MTALTDRPIETISAGTPSTSSGTPQTSPSVDIGQMRSRIDALDAEMVRMWQERTSLSQQIGAARVASGGTRLVLSREDQIIRKFRDELGPIGAELAVLILRAGRGRL